MLIFGLNSRSPTSDRQDGKAPGPEDAAPHHRQQTVVYNSPEGKPTTALPLFPSSIISPSDNARKSSLTSRQPVVDAVMGRPTAQSVKDFFKSNLLPFLTISGVVGGVILGLILRYSREEAWSKREIMYVGYLGEVFLRSLKALIIPLIVSSLVSAIGKSFLVSTIGKCFLVSTIGPSSLVSATCKSSLVSAIGTLDLSLSKKIGMRAVAYYMTTTVSAVVLGIILVVSIRPGAGGEEGIKKAGSANEVTTPDLLMDLVRNIFPPNLVQACFQNYYTVLIPPSYPNDSKTIEEWNGRYNWTHGQEIPKEEYDISGAYRDGMNIMGLVSFATMLGVALSILGAKGKPLLNMFTALSDASMIITSWLIWISPLGIMFLIASMLIEMEDFSVMLGQLGWYFLTVVIGVFIHGFIVLPLLYTVLTRRLPFRFLANMTQAYITAFATASSTGTLPVTFQCLEEKNHIDPRVTRFVIPIGATINMDGTALYEAVAAIFITQVKGMSLGIGQIIAISITATAAAIGAAGIPQAGLVTMVMVLDVVGLPAEDVTLIIAVDWLLDRFRTMINVLGDSIGAGLVYELSKKELDTLDEAATAAVTRGPDSHPAGEIALDNIESCKM
ncbi:Sodium:dicarboxylate symporter [Trinorchestia longiramus]|nr:Sodium:dicarboxylate symporter [Trinorchestia longiramus]